MPWKTPPKSAAWPKTTDRRLSPPSSRGSRWNPLRGNNADDSTVSYHPGHGAVGLDEWLTRFEQLGIRHSPIAEREYGAVLTFKDPDDIQFEIFFTADHP